MFDVLSKNIAIGVNDWFYAVVFFEDIDKFLDIFDQITSYSSAFSVDFKVNHGGKIARFEGNRFYKILGLLFGVGRRYVKMIRSPNESFSLCSTKIIVKIIVFQVNAFGGFYEAKFHFNLADIAVFYSKPVNTAVVVRYVNAVNSITKRQTNTEFFDIRPILSIAYIHGVERDEGNDNKNIQTFNGKEAIQNSLPKAQFFLFFHFSIAIKNYNEVFSANIMQK